MRGRPRTFETPEALASVSQVFWKHGFAGTSLGDLCAATGLHKPSLYGALGDKRQMYVSSLKGYLDAAAADLRAALAEPDLRASLGTFFARGIATFTQGGSDPRGCFMISTAVPIAADDAEIGVLVTGAMRGLDDAILRRVEAALAAGELPADSNPKTIANFVLSTHYGIAARARAGFAAAALEDIAADAIALICGDRR